MIRGNGLGFAMVVVAGLMAGIGSLVFKFADAAVMMGVGTVLIVMDLIFRLRFRQHPDWLRHRQFGGYFFYVPIWGLGLAVLVLNAINVLSV